MPKSYICMASKAVTTVALVAGAGALVYVGFKYYKAKFDDSTEKDEQKTPEEVSPPEEVSTAEEVEPSPKPEPSPLPNLEDLTTKPTTYFVPDFLPKSEDSIPQPTESFVLVPPKEQDDKSHEEFDPSVDTIPVRNNDEDNSFIKVSNEEEDDRLPEKLDVSDLPTPIQKLDELVNLVDEFEDQVKQLPETLEEEEKHLEESSYE